MFLRFQGAYSWDAISTVPKACKPQLDESSGIPCIRKSGIYRSPQVPVVNIKEVRCRENEGVKSHGFIQVHELTTSYLIHDIS